MCGIAGIIRVTPATDPQERARAITRPHAEAIPELWLDILDASIRHRGPDGQGRFRDRAIRADGAIVDVALVHRRLSIIDHSGGAQPMVSLRGPVRLPLPEGGGRGKGGETYTSTTNPDATALPPPLLFHGKPSAAVDYRPLHVNPGDNLVAVAFNGCIYNHRELRAELQASGHRFESDHSDTEVLLHGTREFAGGGLYERIDGMLAALVWERDRALLTTSRDRFGQKPLYALATEWQPNNTVLFSSALPGLARVAKLFAPLKIRSQPLLTWVRFGYSMLLPIGTGQATAISALPGSVMVHGGTSPDSLDWWGRGAPPPNGAPNAVAIDNAVRLSIRAELEADVPIGCFLSGGIDSALIAGIARENRSDFTAFTVRMPDSNLDESEAAATTARALGIRHEILDCDPNPAEDLIHLIGQLGLPFGDSSLLPTHWVSAAAGARVKVALAGDGGDEMFLGYHRHQAIRWLRQASLLPVWFWAALRDTPLEGPDPKSRWNRFWRLASALSTSESYRELLALFPSPLDQELGLNDSEGRPTWFPWEFAMRPRSLMTSEEHADACVRLDRMFYLGEDLLRKSDTASMSVPLEVRSPLLGRSVANLAASASIHALMPRGQRKGLLRQVARKYLPAEIVDRPKQGFAIPIGEWFRSDYGGLRTLLLDRLNSREPFGPPALGIDLNMTFVRQMLDEHLGTGLSGMVTRDHSQRLYMLLVLSIWADTMR